MKCNSCGANLKIEDEFCPYCGTVNLDAVRHRQDMQEYQQEFQRTRSDVYQSAKKFSSINIRIITILVLVVLLLLSIILNVSHYDISSWIKRTQAASMVEQHRAKLEELEAAGEYQAFYAYYNANTMYYLEGIRDFYKVYYVSNCYANVMDSLGRLITRDEMTYLDADREVRYLCNYADELYERAVRGSYDSDEEWSPEHAAAIEDMKAEVNLMLMTYCNLNEEDLAVFEAARPGRKQIMIEEGLGFYEE